MNHTLQKMPYLVVDEAALELNAPGRVYPLPCLLRSDSDTIATYPENICLKTLLLDVIVAHKPLIVLIGSSVQIKALEQLEWVVFGQQHGFIFQWQTRPRTIEIFNLLCEEKRSCIAFLKR